MSSIKVNSKDQKNRVTLSSRILNQQSQFESQKFEPTSPPSTESSVIQIFKHQSQFPKHTLVETNDYITITYLPKNKFSQVHQQQPHTGGEFQESQDKKGKATQQIQLHQVQQGTIDQGYFKKKPVQLFNHTTPKTRIPQNPNAYSSFDKSSQVEQYPLNNNENLVTFLQKETVSTIKDRQNQQGLALEGEGYQKIERTLWRSDTFTSIQEIQTPKNNGQIDTEILKERSIEGVLQKTAIDYLKEFFRLIICYDRELQRLKALLGRNKGFSVDKVFELLSCRNKDGFVYLKDFKKLISKLKIEADDEDIEAVFNRYSTDNNSMNFYGVREMLLPRQEDFMDDSSIKSSGLSFKSANPRTLYLTGMQYKDFTRLLKRLMSAEHSIAVAKQAVGKYPSLFRDMFRAIIGEDCMLEEITCQSIREFVSHSGFYININEARVICFVMRSSEQLNSEQVNEKDEDDKDVCGVFQPELEFEEELIREHIKGIHSYLKLLNELE